MRRAYIGAAVALSVLAANAEPLRVGGDVKAPVCIKRVEPRYPSVKTSVALIILEMVVDRAGGVRDVKVIRGAGPLADAAVAAVKQWKFKPATYRGKPVDVFYNMTVHLCPR